MTVFVLLFATSVPKSPREKVMDNPIRHPPSPRVALLENGVPDVKPILQAAGGGIRSPRHSPTPNNRPTRSPTAVAASPTHYKPQHIHRTPTKIVHQRVVTTPPPQPVRRTQPAANTALALAKQQAAERASRDVFDDPADLPPAPQATIAAPPAKPAPSISPEVLRQMRDENAVELPLGYVRYRTPSGVYIMPDYDKLTSVEQQHARYDFETKIAELNKAWNAQGCFFDSPPANEHLSTTFIRLDGYRRTVKKRSTMSLWWLMAGIAWIGCEYVATEFFKLKADGFAANQLKIYKIYQPKLTEFGEGSGFGEEWSPITQFAVTSALSLAVVVGIGTWHPSSIQYAGEIINELNGIITGDVIAEVDEHGNPVPPKEGLMDKLSKIDFSNMTVSKGIKLFRTFTRSGTAKEDNKPKAAAAPPPPPTAEEVERARAQRNARNVGLDD